PLVSRLFRPVVLLPLAALVIAVAVPTAVAQSGGSLSVTGVRDGAVLNAKALESSTVFVRPDGVDTKSLKATLDGKPVTVTEQDRQRSIPLTGVADGKHVLK